MGRMKHINVFGFLGPPRDAIFPTRERENGLLKENPSTKAIFPFSRGKNRISQGVENRGSLISVPLALREYCKWLLSGVVVGIEGPCWPLHWQKRRTVSEYCSACVSHVGLSTNKQSNRTRTTFSTVLGTHPNPYSDKEINLRRALRPLPSLTIHAPLN